MISAFRLRKYDILGRLVSFENSEWYYDDAVDEQGLVEVEEKRTIDYPSEGVVRDETVRKSYYDDGTSMTEERYITCVNDLRDRNRSGDATGVGAEPMEATAICVQVSTESPAGCFRILGNAE